MERQLSCEEVFQRLDDYLDRELSTEEMKLVAAHLADCAICASEYRFEAGLLSSMKEKLRRVQMPEEVRLRLMAQLKDAKP